LFTKRFKSLARSITAARGLLSLLLCAFVLVSAASATVADSPSTRIKKLGVSPKKLNFGKLPPLMPGVPKTATIRNPNSMAIDISSIASSNPEFVPSANCVGSLAAKGTCVVSIVFTPSSDGEKSAKLIIASSASSKALDVKMTGAGKGAPVVTAASCPIPEPGACPESGPPTLLSLIPSSAVAGAPAIPLAVCGCNLTASTAVQWNGAGRTTSFISSNQVNASIPPADVAGIGVDEVTVSAASVVSAPQTFFVGSSGGTGFAEVEIDQEANDIVNDPVNKVLYLSVPGTAPTNGNTISVISLATAQITSSPFAGSNPDALAISDDSAYLYAGIDGSASVRRFTLPSLTTDISIPLGSDSFFGPYFALDLQVAPGAPHTTAVTLGNMGVSPEAEGGIVIFDDSMARATKTPGFGGVGGGLFDSLQWGSDDTALYASNYEDSGFDFYILSVSLTGVVLDTDLSNDIGGYNKRIHFDPGTKLIYSDFGDVVDTSGNPVGSFTPDNEGVMVPDSTLGKTFFVAEASGDMAEIQAFDQQKFTSLGSIMISNTANPVRIVRWGTNGIAFNTHQGAVYLIGGNFVH